MERTLVFLKPDAVQRGLVGPIIARIERRGLKLAGLKIMRVSEVLARRHYMEHEGKPFYEGLVQFVTSSPIVATVWEGKNAVQVARDTIGATDPAKAAPGTIRADFGMDLGRNLVHGSDSLQSAVREVGLFFSPDELVEYSRDNERWITES